MPRWFKPRSKLFITLSALYALYLIKTLLGINLSSQHSAPWLLKVPLAPIEIGKDQLCKEVEAACINRKTLHRKFRRGIRKVIS